MNTPYISKLASVGGFMPFDKLPFNVHAPSGTNFGQILQSVAGNVNGAASKPDDLLEALLKGDPSVDIHDVMIANTEAELAINTTTQSLTKVLQAYDKILQIQL
jgi:flagellar hook-basal body complex protein FliE